MSPIEREVDVRPLEPRLRHPAVFEAFDSLAPGESIVLVNDHDPRPLLYQFHFERPDLSEAEYVESGPTVWRVRIARKSP